MAEDMTENGEREVFFELNGTLRSVLIKDKDAGKEIEIHPKADKTNKKQIGAPMPGTVIDVRVMVADWVFNRVFYMSINSYRHKTLGNKCTLLLDNNAGDKIEKGTPLVILSAMKMETVVQSPVAGVIKTISATVGTKLEAEDLIITME